MQLESEKEIAHKWMNDAIDCNARLKTAKRLFKQSVCLHYCCIVYNFDVCMCLSMRILRSFFHFSIFPSLHSCALSVKINIRKTFSKCSGVYNTRGKHFILHQRFFLFKIYKSHTHIYARTSTHTLAITSH